MTTCYINGKYYPIAEAKISITDRGFQFSDGIYEVITVYKEKFVDLDLHLYRLLESLKKIDIKINLDKSQIEKISRKIQKINNLKMGIIYIQITRGNQHPRDHKYKQIKPNIIIYSIKKDLNKFDQTALKGAKATLYPDIRWLRSDIKSISLLGNVFAANHAKNKKAHEAILYNEKKYITEGNSSSVWIIKNNVCKTHPLTHRILKGCTRAKLISLLIDNKYKFKETIFSTKELLNADEVFITSATNFVMPITKIDEHTIGNGKPGSISLSLRKSFIKAI